MSFLQLPECGISGVSAAVSNALDIIVWRSSSVPSVRSWELSWSFMVFSGMPGENFSGAFEKKKRIISKVCQRKKVLVKITAIQQRQANAHMLQNQVGGSSNKN